MDVIFLSIAIVGFAINIKNLSSMESVIGSILISIVMVAQIGCSVHFLTKII